jgi:hypothetical protein
MASYQTILNMKNMEAHACSLEYLAESARTSRTPCSEDSPWV